MALSDGPTHRFTGRAAVYQTGRPGYPEEIIPFLTEHAGLAPRSRVIDLGCGTGIFSALLLDAGAEVTGIEPNQDMRNVAIKTLAGQPGFHAVAAAAETSMLPGAAFHLATAAQSYHWFDEAEVAKEIIRVVRPPHHFFAVWNERLTDSAFDKGFDAICRKYRKDNVAQTVRDEQSFPKILRPDSIIEFKGQYEQPLELAKLIDRAESNSGFELGSEDARRELTDLFSKHAKGDFVTMRYRTVGYLGEVQLIH